ncbi:MAG: response regulator [Actinomycetota bacterium]
MREPVRVLIVDDDFRVADIHRGFAEEVEGLEVVGTAKSAQEAFELCVATSPNLVLLDIYLPDTSGTEVLRRLRVQNTVDCFVLTAARDVATVKRCLDLGALHYLVKPFSKDELTDRLREYLAWRASMPDDGELDQLRIDDIFNGRGRPQPELPKGLSAETMALVRSALDGAGDPLGAEDVAQLTGISRVSVRRYLRHLADSGKAELVQDYGTPGRPRHRFRLIS